MPLENTSVFHPGWNTHHRPTATSAMTSTCRITRRSGAATTGTDGTVTPPAATPVYEGQCRVVPRATDQGVHRTSGDDVVTPRRYEVSLTYDAPTILLGDTVTVTAAADAGLVGVSVRVIDVSYSSEQWQRMLFAQEIQEATP